MGSLKGNWLGLQKFLPLTQSSLVFAARSYEGLFPDPGTLGWGHLVWGWDSSLPRYPYAAILTGSQILPLLSKENRPLSCAEYNDKLDCMIWVGGIKAKWM